MGIDTMIILVLIPFLLVLLAQIILKITYRKYESIKTDQGLTGKEVEAWLDEANITANKNTIPNDPQSPFVTSGVRLGTAAVTTRGMNAEDMDRIAEAIAMIIDDHEANIDKAKEIVKELTDRYPLY